MRWFFLLGNLLFVALCVIMAFLGAAWLLAMVPINGFMAYMIWEEAFHG